jgi:hypothetical protein
MIFYSGQILCFKTFASIFLKSKIDKIVCLEFRIERLGWKATKLTRNCHICELHEKRSLRFIERDLCCRKWKYHSKFFLPYSGGLRYRTTVENGRNKCHFFTNRSYHERSHSFMLRMIRKTECHAISLLTICTVQPFILFI